MPHFLSDMILELDDGAQVKETTDGYMTAFPRVARTGVQLYRGKELGMPSKDIVRIYRDEAQVFNKDSLATFAGKPFTDNHPPQMVTAKNWKKYSAGDAGDEVLRDGEYIRIPMMLRDANTIAKVKGGKSQLSVGYGCEIDWTSGTTPTGDAYDGRQTNIQVNHIAVVDAARGGPKLAIGDGGQETNHPLYTADGTAFDTEVQPQKETKDMKTIVVDGITCEMSDTAVEVVRRALDKFTTDAAAAAKKFGESEADYQKRIASSDAAVAKLTTDLAARDAEIVTLKKTVEDSKITADKLDQMVKDRAVVADKAKALLTTVVVDGKSVDDIMKQVVDAKIGEPAKAWNADQIKVSFDTMAAAIPADGATNYATDGVTRTARAFSVPLTGDAAQKKEQMYDKADKALTEAWKTPVATH